MIAQGLRAAWRLGLAAFFRRIEVEGLDQLPAGPLLLVPNHTNAFVDAFLVATVVPRPVTLTAKSTLFGQPVLRLLLRASGAIALHRRQDLDEGAHPSANREALAECRRRLSDGHAVCIFPEGVSHSDGRLRPLRTGAARVALDFVETERKPLSIVPVGLVYEAKEKFRSAVWVRLGSPIEAAAWRKAHPEKGPRELSAEIENRLRELTLNFRNRRESPLLQWTAEVLATRGAPPRVLGRDTGALPERATLTALLNDGYQRLAAQPENRIGDLEDRVRAYHRELRGLGISPAEVFLEMNAGPAALFAVREIEMLVIGMPLALIGAVLHGPAYLLARAIVRRITVDRDHWATNAIMVGGSLILVSATLELIAAWAFLPWPAALALTALLPYSGFYALLYRDRAGGVFRRSRTFLRLLSRPSLRRRLADEGREIISGIESLAAELPA